MQQSETENDSPASPLTSSSQNIVRTIPEVLPPEYSLNIPIAQTTGQTNLGEGNPTPSSTSGQSSVDSNSSSKFIPERELSYQPFSSTRLTPESNAVHFIPPSTYSNKVVIGFPQISSNGSSSDQNCFSCCPGCSVSHNSKTAMKETQQTSTKSSKGKTSSAMRYFKRKKSDGVQTALESKKSESVAHSHSCDAIHTTLVKPLTGLVIRDAENGAVGSRTMDSNSALTIPLCFPNTDSGYNVQSHLPIVPNTTAPLHHSFYVNPPPPPRDPHRETVPFSGPGPPPPYSSLAPPPYSYVALDNQHLRYRSHLHNNYEAQQQWTTKASQKEGKQMLSVQSPGCAGMERLGGGGGAGAAGGGGPTVGGKGKRRDPNDLTLREVNMILELRARSARCVQTAEHLNCPPHIALPDGEGGPDRHLQLRVPYQQSELTRTTVQPPPNKSVMDVPEWTQPLPICPGGTTHKPLSPHKKDGFMQKAIKYMSKIGGGKQSPEGEQAGPPTQGQIQSQPPLHREERRAPCVMVPLTRPPPAPAPPHPPHPPPT